MVNAIHEAHAKLDLALAGALERVTEIGTTAEIERLINLMVKMKIVMELVHDKICAIDISVNLEQTAPIEEPVNQPVPLEPSGQTEDTGPEL